MRLVPAVLSAGWSDQLDQHSGDYKTRGNGRKKKKKKKKKKKNGRKKEGDKERKI